MLIFRCLAVIGLVGCSTIPTAGPTTSEIMSQATKSRAKFAFFELDDRIVTALAPEPTFGIPLSFLNAGKPPEPTIGVGDSISVSIWDSGGGGMFGAGTAQPMPGALSGLSGTGSRNFVVPEQVVAGDGAISIPFIGRILVANSTPFQVQQKIQVRLAKSAIEPQVIVTVTRSISQSVTVSGETTSGARIPLSGRGDRLLDVIAVDGGSKSAPHETVVHLTRRGLTAAIPMGKLVSDPVRNIYVWPGDVITIAREPRTFSVFGATTNNLQVPFGADRVNLAQAIAKAGGLQDSRSDPAGVFLFRFEPPQVISALGGADGVKGPLGHTPVVYHLNLRDISGYFLARRIAMRDEDIVYIANAPMTDLQKFFTLLGTISAPIISGVVVSGAPH